MTALAIAVVGHTNVGKTSLLRTLLRDAKFGEVSPLPSTTIQVNSGSLHWDSNQLDLFDTPGLEDGIGLYEYLQLLMQREQIRHQGQALLERFLSSPEANLSFAQEAKVIRQLLRSDAALYVVDVRDPVLPKFQDELAILSYSGKPILPILNFTAGIETHKTAWQVALSEVNLHVWVEFDSVTPPEGGETEIYQRLATLLPGHRTALQSLERELTGRRLQRQRAASQMIAEALVDIAALKVYVNPNEDDEAPIATLKSAVRKREQRCVDALLRLYNFQPDSIDIPAISIQQGRWQDDLFNPYSLKQFGIHTGKRAAGGAAIGAGIDVVMLGTTLGAGTLVGATLGGAWQTWQTYGQKLREKIRGVRELSAEDSVLELLCTRLQHLVQHLSTRAHANAAKAHIDVSQRGQLSLLAILNVARAHPHWSNLTATDTTAVSSKFNQMIKTHLHRRSTSDYEQRTELVNNLSEQLTMQRKGPK